MNAIAHTAVIINASTDYAAAVQFGQLWIGTDRPGASDLVVNGDAAAFERFAAALMLAATEMREAALVEALGPSGQPATTTGAAA